MSVSSTPDLDRVLLVDPSDFTPPYDLALADAIQAEGRHVRVVGEAGGLSDTQRFHHGHFYPILASAWGRRLPSGTVRLIKGACHGIDMLRLVKWLPTNRRRDRSFSVVTPSGPRPLDYPVTLATRAGGFDLARQQSVPGRRELANAPRTRRSIADLHAIIVHTQQAETRVAETGINTSLIHRIPHGLLGVGGNPAAFSAPRSYRDRDRLVLLQFGKIKPYYKGVDLLLEALTLVPSDLRERLDVRIIGEPYMDTAELEHFIYANGLAHCVTVRFDFVSEAEEERLFAKANAIVLPYRDIDASGVAMSAVARGVPVLATAIPGFRELFEGKGGARLVPPGDGVGLAKAITDWINAPAQLDALAEGMRLRRAGIPSWNEIARLHLAVYKEAYARWMTDRSQDGSSPLAVRRTS